MIIKWVFRDSSNWSLPFVYCVYWWNLNLISFSLFAMYPTLLWYSSPFILSTYLAFHRMLELSFHHEKKIVFHFLLHLRPSPSLINLLQLMRMLRFMPLLNLMLLAWGTFLLSSSVLVWHSIANPPLNHLHIYFWATIALFEFCKKCYSVSVFPLSSTHFPQKLVILNVIKLVWYTSCVLRSWSKCWPNDFNRAFES